MRVPGQQAYRVQPSGCRVPNKLTKFIRKRRDLKVYSMRLSPVPYASLPSNLLSSKIVRFIKSEECLQKE